MTHVAERLDNECLICSIEKMEFEKREKSFKMHVKEEHRILYYIYFIIYLNNKRRDEFSGIELYVYNLLVKLKSTDWFPNHKTMFLESNNLQSLDIFDSKLKRISKQHKDFSKQILRNRTLIEKSFPNELNFVKASGQMGKGGIYGDDENAEVEDIVDAMQINKEKNELVEDAQKVLQGFNDILSEAEEYRKTKVLPLARQIFDKLQRITEKQRYHY